MNLLRTASQGEAQLRVRTAPELINISSENLFRYHLVFMHGRHEFGLTPAEREKLHDYIERGGTLLADSICASKSFTAAFRREIAAALPGKSLERIPPDDPLFTESYGGYDVRQVSLRDPEAVGDNQPVAARIRQVRAATGRHQNRRPLGRDLFAVRHQLRTGKPRSDWLPWLHAGRCGPLGSKCALVFAESVTFSVRFSPLRFDNWLAPAENRERFRSAH